MAKSWTIKQPAPAEFFAKFPEYSPLLVQALYTRNLQSEQEVEAFLNPKYEDLPSPFLFLQMQTAVDRLWEAIEKGQSIYIYGDYDADAVTANAVLQQTFRYLGVKVRSYIPDRFAEGYGVNLEALQKIKDEGAQVIITVDCGTNSVDAADFCKQQGMDLIITDHHEILGPVPQALALVNPKNSRDNYPYREITGVGVAFKLASAMLSDKEKVVQQREKFNQTHIEGWEKWLLDLVAIGTVADCHSLLEENRILVKYGLKVLAKSKWAGLRALLRSAGLNLNVKAPDTYTLGFIVAPRLNAAGRLEHANIALDLLMQEDVMRAQEEALRLEEINSRRQQITEQVLSAARGQAVNLQGYKVLVLLGQGWPKGVVGLVAGRLVEEFNRPVIVLAQEGEHATGSARTVGKFDLVELLKAGQEHLVKFGGHQQAAGLTLKAAEYEVFYQKLLGYAEANLKATDLDRTLELEAALASEDLNLERVEELKLLEPVGAGNPRLRFWLPEAEILSLKTVGNGQKHLQAQVRAGAQILPAVGFGQGYFATSLQPGNMVEIACELMEDSWGGTAQLKLKILDIKVKN